MYKRAVDFFCDRAVFEVDSYYAKSKVKFLTTEDTGEHRANRDLRSLSSLLRADTKLPIAGERSARRRNGTNPEAPPDGTVAVRNVSDFMM